MSIEYNAMGSVAAARIAPAGYLSNDNKPERSMDHADASELLDFFVPPERRGEMLESLNCLSTLRRDGQPGKSHSSCGLNESNKEISISRRYIQEEASERDRFIEIQSKAGLPLTAYNMESRFGPPVTERFVAAPGIGVSAIYDDTRTATQIVIAPIRPLLERDDQTLSMTASDAEQVLNEIVPLWTRGGLPERAVRSPGVTSLESSSSIILRSTYRILVVACQIRI